MRASLLLLVLGVVVVSAQRRLALPDPRSCANRVRHSTYRDARGVAHAYFFSWEHAPTRNLEVDWLDARNICRRHCMDAVSLETPQENEFIKQRIARGNVRYIWTSGRKCNFNGCDRPDLQPANVNGWFWSGSGAKIGPTTQRNTGDWSHTGGFGQPQPDNREAPQVGPRPGGSAPSGRPHPQTTTTTTRTSRARGRPSRVGGSEAGESLECIHTETKLCGDCPGLLAGRPPCVKPGHAAPYAVGLAQ